MHISLLDLVFIMRGDELAMRARRRRGRTETRSFLGIDAMTREFYSIRIILVKEEACYGKTP